MYFSVQKVWKIEFQLRVHHLWCCTKSDTLTCICYVTICKILILGFNSKLFNHSVVLAKAYFFYCFMGYAGKIEENCFSDLKSWKKYMFEVMNLIMYTRRSYKFLIDFCAFFITWRERFCFRCFSNKNLPDRLCIFIGCFVFLGSRDLHVRHTSTFSFFGVCVCVCVCLCVCVRAYVRRHNTFLKLRFTNVICEVGEGWRYLWRLLWMCACECVSIGYKNSNFQFQRQNSFVFIPVFRIWNFKKSECCCQESMAWLLSSRLAEKTFWDCDVTQRNSFICELLTHVLWKLRCVGVLSGIFIYPIVNNLQITIIFQLPFASVISFWNVIVAFRYPLAWSGDNEKCGIRKTFFLLEWTRSLRFCRKS